MPETRRLRRYYLQKRQDARALEQFALESVWRGKQEAEPGEPLPVVFPFAHRLAAEGYTAVEDLDGADINELQALGFSRRDTREIFKALSELQGTT